MDGQSFHTLAHSQVTSAQNEQTPSLLGRLPLELQLKLIGYLELKDLNHLAQSCRLCYGLFQSSIKAFKLPMLLEDVAKGRQEQAQRILKIDPTLLLLQAEVIDYSGRIFYASPFELALWYLDRYMWNMMLECLPVGENGAMLKRQLYLQYKALRQAGLTYKLKGSTYTELHFNFEPLLYALDSYCKGYADWSEEERINYWCQNVGDAQRMVPVHVANEYCHPERGFYPPYKFNEQDLKRTLGFFNYVNNGFTVWFPLYAAGGLGVNFAVAIRHGVARGAVGKNCNAKTLAATDLLILNTLFAVRRQELLALKEQLLHCGQKFSPKSN